MSSILNSIKKTIKKHVTPKQYEIDKEVDRRLAAKKERREAKKAEDKRSNESIADLERRLRALEIRTLPDVPTHDPRTHRKRGGKRTRKNSKSRKHRK
jgi:hypothetical protein